MTHPAPSYRSSGTLNSARGMIEYGSTDSTQDPAWDHFLSQTPQGQFQQSGMWAHYKAIEGWKSHRVLCRVQGRIVGGFQCLWRTKGPLRVGYVMKGPVASTASEDLLQALGTILIRETRRMGISLLVSQWPDAIPPECSILDNLGFLRSNPFHVVQATCLIRTDDGIEGIRQRMGRSTRNQVNRSRTKGVEIREGTAADLPEFFRLMEGSCLRQQTQPNPSSLPAVEHLWASFAPSRSIRLSFAVCQGELTSAALCLGFGKQLSLWKKGWNSQHADHFPNDALYADVLNWAFLNGFEAVDHCAFDLQAALQAREKGTLKGVELWSRDVFAVRFGGAPKILPPALIYIPNPAIRFLYRKFYLPREQKRNLGSSLPGTQKAQT